MRTICILLLILCTIQLPAQQRVWTTKQANEWYSKQPWLVGCNFIPSSAINELEMWQPETFDLQTIDKELGWAAGIGMNLARVFLHYIPWQADPQGMKERIKEYLLVSERHGIKTMFVLFDDCWNPAPQPGKQPVPIPGTHNSGWMQCPGKKVHNDSSAWEGLERYTKDILKTFENDPRILCWDLYNEPGNSNYGLSTLPLLKRVFQWAWVVRPSQPITCGIWEDNSPLNEWMKTNSDVISFHNYGTAPALEKEIQELEMLGRPVLCSEYMARPRGSKFETHLPIFKQYKVAAVNWGLVAGKTNTIFEWNKPIASGAEPATWFHDIFRKDGTPFDLHETAFIKKITTSK